MPDALPLEVVAAFLAATITTFEELAQTSPVPGEVSLTRTAPPVDWVTAAIGLRRAAEGRLVVAFPRPVLVALTERYLGDGTPLTPELVDDAAGEFANVIAGQAKTMLHGTPYHYALSTPKVGTQGDPAGSELEFLALPFHTDAGGFTVLVALQSYSSNP